MRAYICLEAYANSPVRYLSHVDVYRDKAYFATTLESAMLFASLQRAREAAARFDLKVRAVEIDMKEYV